jgi:hypothetical protein
MLKSEIVWDLKNNNREWNSGAYNEKTLEY